MKKTVWIIVSLLLLFASKLSAITTNEKNYFFALIEKDLSALIDTRLQNAKDEERIQYLSALNSANLRPFSVALGKNQKTLNTIIKYLKNSSLALCYGDESLPSPYSEADPKSGNTDLHRAVLGGSLDGVKFLLDYGHPVDAQNERGETPLHHAVMLTKGEDIVHLLLERGASPRKADNYGRSPLNRAPQYSPEYVELLTDFIREEREDNDFSELSPSQPQYHTQSLDEPNHDRCS